MNFNGPVEIDFSDTFLNEQSTTGRKSSTHLRRSCEVCRFSKSRCCPSIEDSTRCQRCTRDGKQCVFLEAKPRPKRVRTSKTRVAEMEEKLDGLLSLISVTNRKRLGMDLDQPKVPPPAPPKSMDQTGVAIVNQIRLTVSDVFEPMTPSPASWLGIGERPDVIGKGIISLNKAETLLRNHGTHAPNFPFVVLQPHWSMEYLRCEKPFLLLSILAICTRSNIPLQERLERELRETLARRVTINGEKNLDILQGLLIYLCWYHHFYTPERQQIYQISQMVISMAIELDITQPPRNTSSISGLFTTEDDHWGRGSMQRLSSEPEVMRTFVGCYYLSSGLSNAFRKQNNLKYTDYVEHCSKALVDANEVPSDRFIPYFIRMQRLSEEVFMSFDYGGNQQLPALDAVRIEILVKTYTRQLKQFKETLPAEVWNIVAIRMAYNRMHIYINEVGLHVTRQQGDEAHDGHASRYDWYSALARTEVLISCIESAKRYLDSYLTLSKEEMHQDTIMEVMKLIYSVLIITRFASGVDSPFVDPTHFRQLSRSSYYMSCLNNCMKTLVLFNGSGQERIDCFWHIRRIFIYTKNWAEEQARLGYFSTLETKGLHECMPVTCKEIHSITPDSQYSSGLDDSSGTFPESEEQIWNVNIQQPWAPSTLDPRTITLNGTLQ